MRPEDLSRWTTPGDPSITPDGRAVVVAFTRADPQRNVIVSSLWVVPTGRNAGPPWRLTVGPNDSAPVVSPDGRWVAFVRKVDKAGQLTVVGLGGGEPFVLTSHPLGVSTLRWSPDSTQIAYVARVPELGRYGTDEEVDALAEAPRLVTTAQYRLDGVGFTRDRAQQVFVVRVPDLNSPGADVPERPTALRLTDGEGDSMAPAWSPDGSRLAVHARRHEGADTDLRDQVWIHPLDSAAAGNAGAELAVTGDIEISGLAWPESERLLLTGMDVGPGGREFVGTTRGVFVAELGSGTAEVRRLTDPESVDAADFAGALPLLADEKGSATRVLVPCRRRGGLGLREISLDSPDVLQEKGNGVDHLICSAVASLDGTVVVGRVSTADRAGDLAVLRRKGDRWVPGRWLTDLSSQLREGFILGDEVATKAPDGYPVHGWKYVPDAQVHGDGPYPTILMVHGGPHAQYTRGVFDETQVYVGAGYAVVLGNPRGSAGYGQTHGRAIKGAMGTVDYDDVMALFDAALEDPRLDSTRTGVMGGSYGGYMTGLITTRTTRFRAAVVERAVLDFPSFSGASDIGWMFAHEYSGDLEAQREQSPMNRVDDVRTPTLVIHSEHDWRCPVDQGQRWYESLRRNGVEAELLLFPGEGHELSRSGRPRHRVQRFEHVLRWWAKHLAG